MRVFNSGLTAIDVVYAASSLAMKNSAAPSSG